MKIRLIVLLMILLLSITSLSSCSSTNAKVITEISQEETNYAAGQILSITISKTLSKFYTLLITSEDYIPDRLISLKEARLEVAGLDRMLTDWTMSSKQYVEERNTEFETLVSDLCTAFNIDMTLEEFRTDNTSLTHKFETENLEALRQGIENLLQDLDLSMLSKAAKQYSTWIDSFSILMDSTPSSFIDLSNTKQDLALKLTKQFFQTMATTEELYRTTPSSDMEDTVSKVLGLE